jgi:hypothetical protein
MLLSRVGDGAVVVRREGGAVRTRDGTAAGNKVIIKD